MLSLRQQRILSLLPDCAHLCDVGCDHGYIGASALTDGKARFVSFIDVSAACLDKARKLCARKGLTACEFLCQDGLGEVAADCAVIAGMGGYEIIDILSSAKVKPPRLVLSPQRSVDKVREFVAQYYRIEQDFTLYDGKFYCLMYLTEGSDVLTEQEILFGRSNLREFSPDFQRYLANELRICGQVLAQANVAEKEIWRRQINLLLKEKYE